MSNQKTDLGGNCEQRRFAARGVRSGMAKDQLVFIIVCSVALVVAALTIVHFFTGGSRGSVASSTWQCLDCNHEFTLKTTEDPPIKCEKCGGQAVRVGYVTCRSCKERVPIYRIRLTAESQDAREARGKEPEAGGPVDSGFVPIMVKAMEIQCWVEQADGSYGWTDWIPAPAAAQLQSQMTCPKCGAPLSGKPSGRGKR